MPLFACILHHSCIIIFLVRQFPYREGESMKNFKVGAFLTAIGGMSWIYVAFSKGSPVFIAPAVSLLIYAGFLFKKSTELEEPGKES